MQQRIINILFGVVIVILTGVVVYLTLGDKTTPVTDITSAPVKTTVKPPVVATDETAGWKTYTDSQYGFEIKYPQSYVVQNIKDGIIAIKSSTAKELADLNIQINQDPSLNNLDLDSIIQNKLKNFAIRDQQKTTLSGQAAYEGISLGMLTQYALLVKNGNNFFEILFNSGNKDSLAENKATLDTNQKLILSSFKFTDQTSDSTTANWQVYNNDKLKFELKYPTDWRVIANEEGAMFGPISIREDTLFGVYTVSKIPTLGTKEDNYEITKIEIVPFDDYSATKVYTKNLSVGMEWANLYIEKNGVILSIGQPTLNNSNFPFENKYNNVVSQILSTFKSIK